MESEEIMRSWEVNGEGVRERENKGIELVVIQLCGHSTLWLFNLVVIQHCGYCNSYLNKSKHCRFARNVLNQTATALFTRDDAMANNDYSSLTTDDRPRRYHSNTILRITKQR